MKMFFDNMGLMTLPFHEMCIRLGIILLLSVITMILFYAIFFIGVSIGRLKNEEEMNESDEEQLMYLRNYVAKKEAKKNKNK